MLLLSKSPNSKFCRSLIASSRYYYDGWVHLISDIDGARLITNDVCEFLQKVPGMYHGYLDLLNYYYLLLYRYY